MTTELGRIWFRGNPWPKGHPIKRVAWSGRLEPDGIYCDLHVESADYYAEDDRDDPREIDDSWRSRIVWGNYHACTLSSTYWPGESKGFLVGTEARPLRLAAIGARRFRVDPLPVDFDAPRAFNVYLLGHDTVADHRITFTRGRRGFFSLTWRARVALTYAGHTDFAHQLLARVPRLRFSGITAPKGMSTREAKEQLARFADLRELGAPRRRKGCAVFGAR